MMATGSRAHVATEATAIATAETHGADQDDEPVPLRHADRDDGGRETRGHVPEERDRQDHDEAERENHDSDQYLTDGVRHDRRSAACRPSRAARGTAPRDRPCASSRRALTLLSAIAAGSQSRRRAAIKFSGDDDDRDAADVGIPGGIGKQHGSAKISSVKPSARCRSSARISRNVTRSPSPSTSSRRTSDVRSGIGRRRSRARSPPGVSASIERGFLRRGLRAWAGPAF